METITGVFPAKIKTGLLKREDIMLILTTKRIILLPADRVEKNLTERESQPQEIDGIPVIGLEEVEEIIGEDKPLIIGVEAEGLSSMINNLNGKSIMLSSIIDAKVRLKDKTLTIKHLNGVEEMLVPVATKDLRELKEQLKALTGNI